jgi:thioredoxin-related protein
MKEIVKEDFEKIIQKPQKNIIIFKSNNCGACHIYLKELSKRNTDGWYIINIQLKDFQYFMNLGLDKMPNTRIYQSGKVIYEKTGSLFESQLKELYKLYTKRD